MGRGDTHGFCGTHRCPLLSALGSEPSSPEPSENHLPTCWHDGQSTLLVCRDSGQERGLNMLAAISYVPLRWGSLVLSILQRSKPRL